MTTTNRLLGRLAWSQVARGAALTLLGAGAVAWPELALPRSMRAAGVLVALSGLADVIVGVRLRPTFRAWPLLAGHGVACIAFGLLTLALPRVSLALGMQLAALWLLLYGVIAGLLALALWPLPRTRATLAGVAVAFIAMAALARWLVQMPEFVAIYLGACFAVLLGLLHVIAGLWVWRVVMPEFAPTIQTGWVPATGITGTRHPARLSDLPPS